MKANQTAGKPPTPERARIMKEYAEIAASMRAAAKRAGVQDMTMDEIDAIIRTVRRERAARHAAA